MDGINGVLGTSKICSVRQGSDGRTTVGMLVLDLADVNYVPADMRRVALHEMIHLLGFGFFGWTEKNLLSGAGSTSAMYIGAGGTAGCKLVGGAGVCSVGVPVAYGGSGTAYSHWRDSVFGDELMTGFLKGVAPLSVMTIKSLEDLGYVVNIAAADPYTVPSTSITADLVPLIDSRFPGAFRRAEPTKARK
jgi:hypothetical protein